MLSWNHNFLIDGNSWLLALFAMATLNTHNCVIISFDLTVVAFDPLFLLGNGDVPARCVHQPKQTGENKYQVAWLIKSVHFSTPSPTTLKKNKTVLKKRVCVWIPFLCLYCIKQLSEDVAAKFFGSHLGRRDEVSCCHRVCCQGCV